MMTKAGRLNPEKLIAEYRPPLRAFIRKRIHNAEDVEDILQDVFYQLFKTIQSDICPIEEVAAWLFRVARNMIINKGKKKQEESFPSCLYDDDVFFSEETSGILLANEAEPPTPEMDYLRSLVWQELEAALSELPPGQREAFEWMEVDGLPAKDVAGMMGVPVGTLLSRKHYAVVHLRKRLRELYEDILDL